MESKTNAPSFTVSLRGYDRMEVDEYLDSLAEALGQVEQAEDRVHGLQAHVDRLNARIADLEERIRSDVPRRGALLGERIAIMLRSAEETAADTVERAEVQADDMAEKARQNVAAAEDQARGAIQRGEDQARRMEAGARAEAAEIIAEAEGRASARTRQIEQWADQVVSHTRAEEARMLHELQQKREKAEAELRALAEQREEVAASIAELRDRLAQALETVGQAAPVSLPAAVKAPIIEIAELGAVSETEAEKEAEVEAQDGASTGMVAEERATEDRSTETPAIEDNDGVDDADEMPWPAAFRPVEDVAEEPEEGDRDEFDTKFDAWVMGSMGPQHFRRL